MGLSVAKQTADFLLSGALGAAISVLYDLFRVIRRRAGRAPVTAVLDVLFWLLAAGAVLWFSMGAMGGGFRLFGLLGLFLGGVLYFLTLSSAVLFLLSKLLDLLLLAVRALFRPIAAFFRALFALFQKSKKSAGEGFKLLKKKCMIRGNTKAPPRRRGP